LELTRSCKRALKSANSRCQRRRDKISSTAARTEQSRCHDCLRSNFSNLGHHQLNVSVKFAYTRFTRREIGSFAGLTWKIRGPVYLEDALPAAIEGWARVKRFDTRSAPARTPDGALFLEDRRVIVGVKKHQSRRQRFVLWKSTNWYGTVKRSEKFRLKVLQTV
jgi:hypothetical protein